MQEPMRVIALSALVLPLGFVAQVAHQHHPPSSGEYAKVLEDPWRDAWQKPQEVVSALARISTKYVMLAGNALVVDLAVPIRQVYADPSQEIASDISG
jgi:hypothetical protein